MTSAPGDAPRRVLIVDDNEDAALSLGAFFELQGHTVEVCHDGLAALEVAARFRPDVALLDISLPGIDGYELASRLRVLEGTQLASLVALSGYGGSSERARAHASGFDEYFTKPANLETLSAIIVASRRSGT